MPKVFLGNLRTEIPKAVPLLLPGWERELRAHVWPEIDAMSWALSYSLGHLLNSLFPGRARSEGQGATAAERDGSCCPGEGQALQEGSSGPTRLGQPCEAADLRTSPSLRTVGPAPALSPCRASHARRAPGGCHMQLEERSTGLQGGESRACVKTGERH